VKIKAHICVERIELGGGLHTYRTEVHEVNVVRVIRSPATRSRTLNRWYYQADIAEHPSMSPHAIRTGHSGAYRVNVQRRGLNDRWQPPTFREGCNVFEVEPSPNGDEPGGKR